MKFQGEIFKALNGEHDGELSKVVFDMAMKSSHGKAFDRELKKLLKDAREAKDETLVKRVLDLDFLANGFRDRAVDIGVAVGFVLGKRFEVGRSAQREFKTIEEGLKADLPLWPRRRE